MTQRAPIELLRPDDATGSAEWVRMSVGDLEAGETMSLPDVRGTVVKAGFWRHAGGALPYARPESTEVIHLLGGEARIAAQDGTAVTLTPGDTCIVRVGFIGEWTTVRPLTKLSFSIIETELEENTND